MINIVQNAKDLIQKGKTFNDPELIQMGIDLLEQYSQNKQKTSSSKTEYVCLNCGHTMPVDKEGRKKCPQCKKHKLQLDAIAVEPTTNRITKDQFNTQIRKNDNRKRVVDGIEEGVYTKTESINGITNVWKDDGKECQDKANETLKQCTNITPRARKTTQLINVTCRECSISDKVHPSRIGGSSYICAKCIRKRSQF